MRSPARIERLNLGLLLPLLLITIIHILASLSLVSIVVVEARKPNAKCPPARDAEMDTCAQRMGFLGDHSFRVPKNVSAMSGFCTELRGNIGCIQAYSRDCLTGFTKQILTSLLKRGKQQHSSICNTDPSKTEFIAKMSACLTDNKIEQFHACMDASIARFEHISKQVPADDRLPALCCSYQIFFRDVEETLGRLCGSSSSGGGGGVATAASAGASGRASGQPSHTEVLKFIQKLVSGTTGEFIQLVCDNHRSIEDCRASDKTRDVLKQLETITKQVKQGKIKNKNKSLIPPLLEILDSSPAS